MIEIIMLFIAFVLIGLSMHYCSNRLLLAGGILLMISICLIIIPSTGTMIIQSRECSAKCYEEGYALRGITSEGKCVCNLEQKVVIIE